MTVVDIADVKKVALLVNKGVDYDLEIFLESCLSQKSDFCLVADISGEIVGVAIGGKLGTLGIVDMLAVAPDYQGSGIGNALLDELTERCRRRGIKTLAVLSWGGSSAFYESLGFTIEKGIMFMTKTV